MSGNISVEKSFDFAVRIVNLYKYLTNEKKEFILSKQLFEAERALEQMYPKLNADKARLTLLPK